MDADGSGCISKSEFLSAWDSIGDEAALMENSEPEEPSDQPPPTNHFLPLLKLFDLKPTGTMVGDAAFFIAEASEANIPKKVALYLFKHYDTDGSGSIERSEGTELVKDISLALDLHDQDFFSQIDTDNSGKISIDEFVEFFVQLCEAV